MSYVRITKEEMDKKLTADKGWICNHSGNEHVYDFHLKNQPIIIKVASSIRLDTGKSRNKGADAIRVFAVEKESTDVKAKIKSGLVKSRRVNRTTNWRTNLEKLVMEIMVQSKIVYDKYRKSRQVKN